MRSFRLITAVLAAVLLSALPAPAQETTQDLEIILDGSGSMAGKIGGRTKMEIAKQSLLKLTRELAPRKDLALALRVYGHQSPREKKDCRDTRLEIPFGRVDPGRVKSLLGKITPRGYTPLAFSLEQAAQDFDLKVQRVRTVILITDGLETCEGDPCRAAREMAGKGIDITLHVIGFGLKKGEAAKLKCLTEPSGGLLLEAGDEAQLGAALGQVVKKALAKNLVVKAVSSTGRERQAHVAVFKAGTKKRLAFHQGAVTRFALPDGDYDLEATDFLTDQMKRIEKVRVAKDQVTEKSVVFDSGRLSVSLKSSRGEVLKKGYVEVWRLEGGKELDHKGTYVTGKPQVFNLAPGAYKIAARLDRLGPLQVAEGIRVEAEAETAHQFTFGRARLSLKVRDGSGKPLDGLVEIWRMEGENQAGSKTESTKAGQVAFTLEPGEYRVQVRRQNPKKAVDLERITVKDGDDLTREAVF